MVRKDEHSVKGCKFPGAKMKGPKKQFLYNFQNFFIGVPQKFVVEKK